MKRKIEEELVRWIDLKLQLNGLAQKAIEDKDARLLFGLAAESMVGIYEQGGNNNGPMVRLIQQTIGSADREPWCCSFVQSCLAYAELKTGKESHVAHTEHVMTMWNQTPKILRVKVRPLKYAIVCWNYEGTASGHTGVVLESFYQKWFRTIEGNTGADGGRDGDGIYYKKRNWYRDGKLVRVGFLKPFMAEQ